MSHNTYLPGSKVLLVGSSSLHGIQLDTVQHVFLLVPGHTGNLRERGDFGKVILVTCRAQHLDLREGVLDNEDG